MIITTVEQPDGTVLDAAPITKAGSLTITERLDKIGDVSLTMPATTLQAETLYPVSGTRYLRIEAQVGSTWATLGRFIVRNKQKSSETLVLTPSGDDILGELSQTNVARLKLETGGAPLAAASVLPAIMAGALPGWSVTGTPSKDVYYKFGDESHFAALTKIATYCGDHFRGRIIGGVKTLEWLSTTIGGFDAVDSGLTAVMAGSSRALVSNPNVVIIVGGLTPVTDDTPRITRIQPRGGGNAEAQVNLNATTRFGAAGVGDYISGAYTLHIDADPWKSHVAWTPGELTAYDVIADPKSFRDIAALGTTATHLTSASNALFDAALADLKQRIYAQVSFRLRITKLHKALLPGQSLHVVANLLVDGYGWLRIDHDVMVLEKKTTWTADGGDPVIDLQVTM